MATIPSSSKLSELIARLDEAVNKATCESICECVKDVLHDVVLSGEDFVPVELLQPADGCYARRLIHKDPTDRYSILAMVWDKGQGTFLHDHAGHWCVECVYRGRIRVVSYSLIGSEHDDVVQFEREQEIFAGVGDAGALIPPFEYHTLENALDIPAVTLHVYAGELDHCHVFVPTDGGYRRERRELKYTP